MMSEYITLSPTTAVCLLLAAVGVGVLIGHFLW